MPPKKDTNAAAGETGTLSSRDMLLLTTYLGTLPPSAKAAGDWDKVANELKLKDAKCARESFRQLCKKHGWYEAAGGDGSSATPVKTPNKPRTSAKKSAKKAADADDTIDDTPTKKAKVKEDVKVPGDTAMEEFFNLNAASEE